MERNPAKMMIQQAIDTLKRHLNLLDSWKFEIFMRAYLGALKKHIEFKQIVFIQAPSSNVDVFFKLFTCLPTTRNDGRYVLHTNLSLSWPHAHEPLELHKRLGQIRRGLLLARTIRLQRQWQ
jgi:hypothetical protein